MLINQYVLNNMKFLCIRFSRFKDSTVKKSAQLEVQLNFFLTRRKAPCRALSSGPRVKIMLKKVRYGVHHICRICFLGANNKNRS